MSQITTHVLDTSQGRPARDVKARLEIQEATSWKELGSGVTNKDGRIADLLKSDHRLSKGTYRLTFETAPYFAAQKLSSFYPSITIVFKVEEPDEHYHVPVLLSPFGYSTYRGS